MNGLPATGTNLDSKVLRSIFRVFAVLYEQENFFKRERRDAYVWITNLQNDIFLGNDDVQPLAAWHIAVEAWLIMKGFIKVTINGNVSPIFSDFGIINSWPAYNMKTKVCTAYILLLIFTMFFSCSSSGDKPLSRSFKPVTNDMVCVPAGWFWMGSEEGEQDEKPAHRIWLDTFYIDRFPITNTQYRLFIQETGHEKPLYWNDERCNGSDQPVVGITWADAMAYCSWRSKKEHADFSLPTEAQWEKAARGEDKRKYPWGNQPPDKKRATTEITEKMPNVGICELGRSPYGVSDLVGNVWNWCLDWYDREYYRKSPERNPSGPAEAVRKVVRGGNWVFLGCCSGTPAYALRISRRNSFHPSIQKKSIGFRCVKTVGGGSSPADRDTVHYAH